MLHIQKILLSAITLVFSEPLMTSNRYPAERFGRAQNGPTFDRQNTIFAASKLLDEIASGRLNPNIWDQWGINKHIRQNEKLAIRTLLTSLTPMFNGLLNHLPRKF